MTTLHLHPTPSVGPAYPFGARVAAAWYLGAARAFAALGRAVAAHRRGPGATASGGASEEALAARELAMKYLDVDPRIAADLAAAADRHERENGVA